MSLTSGHFDTVLLVADSPTDKVVRVPIKVFKRRNDFTEMRLCSPKYCWEMLE